ncbi:MAG TPA: cupin domain-containing protein [Gaiellaceae bacterium]|nr:cupin domain-containing protein [Gaiellaceae bacterium]
MTIQADETPRRPWRRGVESRVHDRASSLYLLEQWSAPGAGAPTHVHHGIEEVILVVAGIADFWVASVTERIRAGGSIVVPAGSWHGFRNAGTGELHTIAVFPSARPTVEYEDEPGEVVEIPVKHEGRAAVHAGQGCASEASTAPIGRGLFDDEAECA